MVAFGLAVALVYAGILWTAALAPGEPYTDPSLADASGAPLYTRTVPLRRAVSR